VISKPPGACDIGWFQQLGARDPCQWKTFFSLPQNGIKKIKLPPSEKSKDVLYPASVILAGMAVCQVIASLQVYFSNIALFDTLSAVREAGYLAIPNQLVADRLLQWATAIRGGLFFTLSVGAGLILVSMAAAWIWEVSGRHSRLLRLALLWLWATPVLFMNVRGLNLFASSYFLLIPPIVFVLTRRFMPIAFKHLDGRRAAFHAAAFCLLAMAWFTQYDDHLFTDLRDHLLLTNPIGRKVNQFYYRYTLYPAEAFKSLQQKTMRTVHIAPSLSSVQRHSLEKALLAADFLPLPAGKPVDLTITRRRERLILSNNNREILQTTVGELVTRTGNLLQTYSNRCDRNGTLRFLTFLSLLLGFPTLLYILLYTVFHLVLRAIFRCRHSAVLASLLCLLVGLGVLGIFHDSRSQSVSRKELSTALASNRWQRRVAALKLIEKSGIDVSQFGAYSELFDGMLPQERYWLAKALAVSRNPATIKDLLQLVDDENLNVRSMAYKALGNRSNRRVQRDILERIPISGSWYVQAYAYRSLRALGWQQKKSR